MFKYHYKVVERDDRDRDVRFLDLLLLRLRSSVLLLCRLWDDDFDRRRRRLRDRSFSFMHFA
ncbi:conserved hypothetical protein, partial [Trichinella spiralis]|uniref:hypothetical protein n=1 Tax=Trichinella spiralis TaxID=6334 RepID=UPI0001EFDA26